MVQKIKKFDRTERELQEFLLFCIFTSGRIGKKSSEISRKLDLFLNDKSNKKNIRPFDWIELLASVKSNHGVNYLYEFLVELFEILILLIIITINTLVLLNDFRFIIIKCDRGFFNFIIISF
jgi:hypothetical protein